MKISLVAPQDISLSAGGLRIQILETARFLPHFDIEVDFFDPWMIYEQHTVDLFHLFAANAASHHLAKKLNMYGHSYVISPVLYSNHQPRFIRWSRQLENWSKKVFSGIWTDYAVMGDTCQMSRSVLPNTRAEARLIQNGFEVDADKIHVVPNGVEKRFLNASPDLFREQYDLNEFILYVGPIGSKRKNVMRLIEALSETHYPAVFIGDTLNNREGQKCRQTIESHKYMHLLDPLPHEDPLLASAFAASRVFVLPSYYETPGISAMEAALAGSSVAITGRGGTREYFNNHAHYLDPESVDSIRNAIKNAWNDFPNHKLKNHIRENYLWPRIAEKTATIYKNIFKDGR